MSVNKFTIERTQGVDKTINVPIELSWDYDGIDQSIDLYEEDIITQVIGVGRDFEVSRFTNEPYTSTTFNNRTEVNYEFYFHSGTSVTNINNWSINYLTEGFSAQDVFYYNRNFSNSFFKLDFYDSPDELFDNNYSNSARSQNACSNAKTGGSNKQTKVCFRLCWRQGGIFYILVEKKELFRYHKVLYDS
jgi:hypothetical protein